MTHLNDINWNDLQDAYGNASPHVSELLQLVIADKSPHKDHQSGPWFELWSRLYHQGSIYTASYAAVPFLVDAIKQAQGRIAMDFFLLPTSIELARSAGSAPKVPSNLENLYHQAVRELGKLAEHYVNGEHDPYLAKAAQAAQLVSAGKYEQASELIGG